MIVTCEFLTLRYVAKATHLEPEWPPHPARIFYALVSALHVFRSEGNESGDVKEREALEWLERLGHPQILAASQSQIRERDVVTHHVPANDPDPVTDKQAKAGGRKPDHLPELRGKSERQFPTLLLSGQTSQVHYCWPGVMPNERQQAALRQLFDRVSYLGHSSSLVALGLSLDDAAASSSELIRWEPITDGRGDIALRSFSKGLLRLLDQRYEPNEFSQQNYRLPHESVLYAPVRTTDEGTVRVPASHFGERWVVYRFPDWVRIPMPAVLSLTTNLKSEACRFADETKLSADLKAMLSGHQPGSDRPYEGPHVAFIGLPYVGHSNASGALFGLAAILPRESTDAHQALDFDLIRRVLHRIASVPFRGQPVPLQRLNAREFLRSGLPETLRPTRWCRPAKVWASVTPLALDKFPGFLFGRARKTEGEVTRTERALAEARASLRQSCVNIGLPAPVVVDVARFSWVEPSPPVSAFVSSKRTHQKPPHVLAHVRIEFDEEAPSTWRQWDLPNNPCHQRQRPSQLHHCSSIVKAAAKTSSAANSDPVNLHKKQLAVIEILPRVAIQKGKQSGHELWNDLGMIVELNADDAAVVRGRIGYDVGEVAVEGKENRVQFLCLGDHDRIGRADRQCFA
jgi:CRISPR-associated protein Csb2